MIITQIEEMESHKAIRRKLRCPNCGGLYYNIHHIVEEDVWWVSCDECHYEGKETPTRASALKWWESHT